MITYEKGDLLQAPEKYILHGCNAKGVMGSGVAKAIREKYPSAYTDYRDVYNNRGLNLGSMILSVQDYDKIIINAITQETYGKTGVHVSYWAIANVFKLANDYCRNSTIAIPMIGAGLGGGDWNVISAIIENTAKEYDVKVYTL